MKWLMVPALAIVAAPLLGGCVVEERYPHAFYHPGYVRYHHWHRAGGVIVVGSADGAAHGSSGDGDVAEAPAPTTVE